MVDHLEVAHRADEVGSARTVERAKPRFLVLHESRDDVLDRRKPTLVVALLSAHHANEVSDGT